MEEVTIPVILAIAGFATSWLVMPKMTGWKDLADKYPLKRDLLGDWHCWQSARFDDVWRYNGCLEIGANADSLYLRSIGPFRIFTGKPLQIPWAAMQSVQKDEKYVYIVINGRKLQISKNVISPVVLAQVCR